MIKKDADDKRQENKDEVMATLMELISIEHPEQDIIDIIDGLRGLIIDLQEVKGDQFSHQVYLALVNASLVANNYKKEVKE